MTVGKSEAEVVGYVLAGGGSTRFGQDKALVEIGGRPMLERMIDLMRRVAPKLKIVGPAEKYTEFGIETVADRWPGEGPLGGIITALLDAAADSAPTTSNQQLQVASHEAGAWCFIVSCDMPFLTEDWLKFQIQRAESSTADVVLPRSAGGFEPLCACWRPRAAEALRQAFGRGVRKMMDGVMAVKAEVLDEKDWKRFDSAGRLFWNMNTPSDYEEARRILEAEGR
jgi:molybdopterin-guanine dinucleotide biosynthesis protein A